MLGIARQAVEKLGAMQKPTELAALLAIVRCVNPTVIWEIGTASGGTLWALAEALRPTDASFVSIDLPGGPFGGGATVGRVTLSALMHGANPASALTIIHGDSRTVELPELRPDFVLIDGDHSADGVRADWERYSPLVVPGGIVALHDIIHHPDATGVEVEDVWREIRENEATVEIVDPSTVAGKDGHQWGGIGVVFR